MQVTMNLSKASIIVLAILLCLSGIPEAQDKVYDNNSGRDTIENQKSGIMLYLYPSDAKIFIDGNEIESSGAIELDSGSYVLELQREGYYPEKKNISVKEGQITGLRISLDQVFDRPFYKYGGLLGANASYNGWYELPAPSLAANKEKFGYGLFGGLFINFPINRSYFLRTEISYLRWEFDYGKERETYKELDAILDTLITVAAWYHVDLDYINCSFLFTQADLDSRGLIHFSLGPSISILSKKKVIIEPEDIAGDVELLRVNRVYFGVNAGLSIGGNFFFETRVHLGFSNIRDYIDGKPLHIRLATGYRL